MKRFFLSLLCKEKKVLFFILSLYTHVLIAHSATLSMSPAITTLKAGSTVTITVFVNTDNTVINGADGNILFSPDILEVTYISRNNSIFPMWVEEPSYSNTTGVITFNGGIPNPGYSGSNGKVLTFMLRSKKEGQASISFSSSNVRANDGLGTNILNGQQSLDITVSPSQVTPPKEPVNTVKEKSVNIETIPASTVKDVPSTPVIISETYPNHSLWYKETGGIFTWSLEKGVTDARLSVTKSSTGKTSVVYSPAVSSKEIKDLTDGVWYFNAQLANDAGWSETAHYSVHVDTKKPEYCTVSKVDVIDDAAGTKVNLKIEAKDDVSGIDYYEISIDNNKAIIWNGSDNAIYTTPLLSTGSHTVFVKAIDKAGNACDSKTEFAIESKIVPPVIEKYQDKVMSGDTVTIEGKTYPNSKVEMIIEKEDGTTRTDLVTSNNEGMFSYVTNATLEKGTYKMFTRVIDDKGVRSMLSDVMRIEVIPEPSTSDHDSTTIIVIVLSLALTISIIVICITVYKLYKIKAIIRKETLLAEGKFHRAFTVLRDEIVNQLRVFEKVKSKRDLTKEEIKIIKTLRLELTKAEELLNEEIEKINDKV
ncbi:MAG: hypothetical protein KBC41_02245 [Candidatus Pacebacteria bacterium]|nr:hypothetical protein [Candidatus Paceibacterota bacterium]